MKKFKQALELTGIFIVVSIVVTIIFCGYLISIHPEWEFKAALNSASHVLALIATQIMLIITILIAWKRKIIRLPESIIMCKKQWSMAALPLALGVCWMFCEWFAEDLISIEVPEEEIAGFAQIDHSILGCLFACIIGPIAEELLMREGLLGCMLRSKVNPWVAIIISAVLFGVLHCNSWQGIPAIGSGILLGILYWKTGNIVIPAIIHIINNTCSTAMQLICDTEGLPYDTKLYDFIGGKNVGIALCCILAIISIALLVKFLKREKVITQ